jgi:hypothetical protein
MVFISVSKSSLLDSLENFHSCCQRYSQACWPSCTEIFGFISGQIMLTICSSSDRVRPKFLRAGPGKILKFRPLQTSILNSIE